MSPIHRRVRAYRAHDRDGTPRCGVTSTPDRAATACEQADESVDAVFDLVAKAAVPYSLYRAGTECHLHTIGFRRPIAHSWSRQAPMGEFSAVSSGKPLPRARAAYLDPAGQHSGQAATARGRQRQVHWAETLSRYQKGRELSYRVTPDTARPGGLPHATAGGNAPRGPSGTREPMRHEAVHRDAGCPPGAARTVGRAGQPARRCADS